MMLAAHKLWSCLTTCMTSFLTLPSLVGRLGEWRQSTTKSQSTKFFQMIRTVVSFKFIFIFIELVDRWFSASCRFLIKCKEFILWNHDRQSFSIDTKLQSWGVKYLCKIRNLQFRCVNVYISLQHSHFQVVCHDLQFFLSISQTHFKFIQCHVKICVIRLPECAYDVCCPCCLS